MAFLLGLLVILIPIIVVYGRQLLAAIQNRLRIIKHVDKLDGPYSLPIIGTVWQFKWQMKEFVMQLRGWGMHYASQGHGMLRVWLGTRPLVIIIRPEAAKIVLESNELITKGPEYDMLLPWLGTGLLISTGDKWRQRRKLLTPSFHFNVLKNFQNIFDFQSKILIEQLEPLADGKTEFDAFPYVKRCALDIICETAMGTTVSAQTNHRHPYVIAVQNMNTLAFKYQKDPWLWIKPIRYMTGFQQSYDKNLHIVTKFTKKVIEEKTKEFDRLGGWQTDEKRAFLDMLIEMRKEGGLTYEDIKDEVDTFMFEGHDTTSASIGWTLWCFAHYPKYQKLVHEELDAIFDHSSRDCTVDDLKKMKYLEKCIKESLRIRPSVPNFTRKVEQDIEIEGKLIPKGCSVLVAPMMIHINPQIYDNAEEFNPDNFNEENITKRHPFSYIPFSAGPRNCIGQKFALQEEKTVISWIMRKFEIESSIPLFTDNMPLPEIITRPELGFPLRLRQRI